MRYYRTQHPITPGSFPTPDGNEVLKIVNFDEITYCEEPDRDCWGCIEYESPCQRKRPAPTS